MAHTSNRSDPSVDAAERSRERARDLDPSREGYGRDRSNADTRDRSRNPDRPFTGPSMDLAEALGLGPGTPAPTAEGLAEQARRRLLQLLANQGRGATLLTGPRGDTSGQLLRARAVGGGAPTPMYMSGALPPGTVG